MRPFKQGLSSFREHVFLRSGVYYFRLDIPSDLTHYFPITEIKMSLRTSDQETAKLAATQLELKALQAYALLRYGALCTPPRRSLTCSVPSGSSYRPWMSP